MKSLLQEAPSVERAISQAWEAAGRPVEFSVKIHDHGKRGFLGFSSSPAVVSITYKPLVAPAAAGSAAKGRPARTGTQSRDGDTVRSERRSSRDDRSSSERSERPERSERSDRSERPERSERSERSSEPGLLGGLPGERTERRGRNDRRSERSDRPGRSDRSDRNSSRPEPRGLLSYEAPEGDEEKKDFAGDISRSTQDVFRKSSVMNDSSSDDSSFGDVWDEAFVDSVITWLKEIMSTMGHDVPFESRVVGKVLHVDFSQDFLNDSELSRSLYASLSFVLLQFLKREHKRRFRGLRIVLSHPGHDVSRIMQDS